MFNITELKKIVLALTIAQEQVQDDSYIPIINDSLVLVELELERRKPR
jgi:hypothetical protein